MYQQLWGYKVEEKLYLGVREQKKLNTTELNYKKNFLRSCRYHLELMNDSDHCARNSSVTGRVISMRIEKKTFSMDMSIMGRRANLLFHPTIF
jgi:hypothetical protein